MAVVVDSGPVSATQRLADVPRERWPELLRARRRFCAIDLPYDCRELLHFADDAEAMREALGYADVSDVLKRGLGLDPTLVTWALQGLRQLKPDDPIPFDRAIALGKQGAPKGNRNAAKDYQTQNKSGRSSFERWGTAEHWLAILDRDHPELAARVRAGELKAKTAARLAGIIKVKTPLDQLRIAWQKASPDERLQFLRECRQ